MENKMKGSYYPNCSSTHRVFMKTQFVDGTYEVVERELVFTAKLLFFIKLDNKGFRIPLNDIVKVETMNLNKVMPFGVCLYLKDGSEIMAGHMNNKKLATFINDARNGMV